MSRPKSDAVAFDPLERLDDVQRATLLQYEALLLDFNRRINLVSREDTSHVFEHHIRHCLFLTLRPFQADSTVVDWGTGGGLPGIPLAVACPDVYVVAVDAVDKKVRAVRAMARRLGIPNLEARRSRAEAFDGAATYSVSRATAPLADLWAWHRRLEPEDGESDEAGRPRRPSAQPGRSARGTPDGCWPPGLICLKGGDIEDEIAAVKGDVAVERIDISAFTGDAYFRGKAILVCTPRDEPRENPYR